MRMRLPVRLFISYAVVVVIGAAVTYVTVRLLAPALFDQHMNMLGGDHMGMGGQSGTAGSAHSAFISALTTALLVGVLASVAAAGLAAVFVTSRLLRPLDAVRAATRRIAAGHYQASVPVPEVPELAALAGDVNTLAAELASTEARRTRLLGEVAHEMRTPLTALGGYVEGLINGVFAPEPETLGAVSDELRRLGRLADDLSALSRAEEQGLDLHPADTDLAGLARRAAGRLAPQFAGRQVTLAVHAAGPLPVRADPDRITQVLTNIIGNALAATPADGTVTVQARTARPASRNLRHRHRRRTGRRGPPAGVRAVLPRPRAAAPLHRLRHRAHHRPQHRPRPRRRGHRLLTRTRARRHLRPHPPPPHDCPGPAGALRPLALRAQARQ